jgi:hypothetical protein
MCEHTEKHHCTKRYKAQANTATDATGKNTTRKKMKVLQANTTDIGFADDKGLW